MSASNTALPRMRAATAIDTVDSGEIPVPFSINTRTNATICKATKKKIVGGSSSKNSFLSVVDSLVMELNCDESFSRSEEHTSELQSPYDLVCRLLLEKKSTLSI